MKLCLLLLTALPFSAFADVNDKFAKLRDDATPVGGLSAFLDKYVGECPDLVGGAECKENAKQFRKASANKKLYMIVSEEAANMLSPGTYDPSTGELTVKVAPFFAAGGYAVSNGAPKKTDSQGNPITSVITVKGTAPSSYTGSQFMRLFSSRSVRVQVVFTPQDVWVLPKRGGGKMYGVKAQVEGILLTVGRTGEELALWTRN